MKVPGFDPRAAAELDALRRECETTNHVEDVITREAVSYVSARGTPKADRAFLRLQIATGYARRRQRSAA